MLVPDEAQLVFTAAIVTGSKQPDSGKRLIAFLASDRTSSAIQKSGMEPIVKAPVR